MPEFVRDNAGKAFEFMVDSVDEERKAAGMKSIQEMFECEQKKREKKERIEYLVGVIVAVIEFWSSRASACVICIQVLCEAWYR